MKRPVLVLIALLALAAGAFMLSYVAGDLLCGGNGAGRTSELAWLQEEFHLGEAEMKRISELHETYKPECEKMCAQLDRKGDDLKRAIDGSTNVTAVIQRILADVATLRTECQVKMLRHFHEVAATMPVDQGRRYLSEMQRLALGIDNRPPLPTAKSASHEQP